MRVWMRVPPTLPPLREHQLDLLDDFASPITQLSVFPISPAASPSPPHSGVDTPWTCREPLPHGCLEPMALPTASEHAGPPQPVVLTPTQTLLPHSFPAVTISHSASPGSVGPSALPCSTPLARASSTFPETSPLPTVTPAQPLASGSLLSPQRVIALAPSWPPWSSAFHHSLGSHGLS